MLPLFYGLTTLFLALAVHRRSWRGPRPTWLCGSFSGKTKPGSQSLTHRKPVRTIEVALDRSESWQAKVRRLLHLVAGDEEGAAVQWGTQGEMAVQLRRKSEVQDAAVVGSLVKVVYAAAWTNRAGAAMLSSGYGKQVPKKKLCHFGGGDKPDGFGPVHA